MFSRRRFVSTSVLFAASVAMAAAVSAADSLDAATAKEVDSIAAKVMQVATRERTPGLAVAVSRGGKVVFARGYGMANLETATPVQPDTVFRIGSITKEFTAAAIMQLVERGELSLDEPLSTRLAQIPDAGKVTIRQLLNHTSGIHSYTGNTGAADLRIERSTEEMIAVIAAQQPLYDFQPGSVWRYSNSGYYLLGAVIEKISGVSLREYFERNLFKPLGMKSTALDQTRELVPNRASGYNVDASAALGFDRADFYPMSRPGGAGAVRSTVLDLVTWHDALFAGRVVSRKSLAAMIEPGRVNDGRLSGQAWFNPALAEAMPDLQYGLGLMHGEDEGHVWIGHSGGISGFSAWVKTYPAHELTIAVVANAGGAPAAEKEIAPVILRWSSMLAQLSTAGGDAAAQPSDTSAPLIERARFFGNPSRANAKVSPDGRWLSWLAPRDGVMNIWVAPTDQPGQASALSAEQQRPIRQYSWAPDSSAVLFATDRGGDENQVFYAVDVKARKQRALTPPVGVRAEMIAISNHVRDRILISVNDRDRKWGDVYSLNIATGQRQLILKNEGYARMIADQSLALRLVSRPKAGGGYDYFRVVDGEVEDEVFATVALEDSWITYPMDFTSDGKTLYWSDSRGRDTAALVAQDMESGRTTIVGESAKADIGYIPGSILLHPLTGRAQAYSINYLSSEWVALDPAVHSEMEFLRTRLKGQITIGSRSDADDIWVLSVDPVDAPPAAYLYRRKTRSLTELFSTRPELNAATLANMHPVEIRTRDGLTMSSYLTLPPGSDPDGDGHPTRPVPLVLYPHGGPWTRDIYVFNANHQWLANRGYAVLSPNFRGSRGFGKKFLSAGNHEWAGKMHDDLIDAVDWAENRRITARDKVAIVGGSYGGYSVLVGMTFTPNRFACGVDMFGMSNLSTWSASFPPHLESLRNEIYARVGDPTTAEGRSLLKARSPFFRVDEISRPLLIGQGANDPRVPQTESDQIVRAMQAKNLPVTYILFPDEGHGFAKPQNSIAFSAVTEQFLRACLGGRAEPIGRSLEGSSISIPHGSQYVPGLIDALR